VVRISTRIQIEIIKIKDVELVRKIPEVPPALRLFCKIKFPEIENPQDALIDTGAHISLIPLQTWENLNVKKVAEHTMKGIIPDKNVPVSVGYVKAKLIDKYGSASKEITFLSYLSSTNKVPLIAGIRDLLERFDLHVLFSQNKAYLEEVD